MARIKDTPKILQKQINERLTLDRKQKAQLDNVADKVRDTMLDLISKGISPIGNNKRFPAYKNPTNYPDRARSQFPGKRRRPVNLFLSGDFLGSFLVGFLNPKPRGKNDNRTGLEISLGFKSNRSKLKERGHREGAGGQPRRPIIPEGNETFSQKITLLLRRELIRVFNL